MDLSPHTTTVQPVDEKRWLGSTHGTDCTSTITLDVDGGSFDDLIVDGGNGYGYIPSGTAVDEDGDLYVLNEGGSACSGHLVESVRVKLGADSTETAGAALLWHGVVNAELVPGGTFDASTDAAAFIRYRPRAEVVDESSSSSSSSSS